MVWSQSVAWRNIVNIKGKPYNWYLERTKFSAFPKSVLRCSLINDWSRAGIRFLSTRISNRFPTWHTLLVDDANVWWRIFSNRDSSSDTVDTSETLKNSHPFEGKKNVLQWSCYTNLNKLSTFRRKIISQ